MLKGLNYVLAVIALTLAIFVLAMKGNIAMSKGNVLLEVYSKYNFNVMQVNMKCNTIVSNTIFSKENATNYINVILNQFEIENITEKEIQDDINNEKYSYIKNGENSKVEIIIENKYSGKIEIKLNITLYENENALLYLQNKINKIGHNFNIDFDTNITIIGTYNQKFDANEKQKIVNNIMACMKATVEQVYENERLYSAYGYSNLINEYTKIENKNVNLHVSIRYNEYEQKTYLYIASPVISVDY